MQRIECHASYGIGGPAFGSGITTLDGVMDDMSPIWDCSLWHNSEWQKMSQGIIDRKARYKDKPTVIFIGHSKACLTQMQAAWRLSSSGIDVAYIAAIDPTALLWFGLSFLRMGPPMVVSKNVKTVDEFWATSGVCAGARRADPSGNSGGRYIYPSDWKGEGGKPISVLGGHIPCASAKITRDTILASVKKVLA